MAELSQLIGQKIRTLRTSFKGVGISQDALARQIGTTANTVSRWETGTYSPSIDDLEAIASFFGIPIFELFPAKDPAPRESLLLSAAHDLKDDDFKEVVQFALFKRVTTAIEL